MRMSINLFILLFLNALASGYYHFVKTHLGLRQKVYDGLRKWRQRTPALAAQITDHIWSTRELLVYRVP